MYHIILLYYIRVRSRLCSSGWPGPYFESSENPEELGKNVFTVRRGPFFIYLLCFRRIFVYTRRDCLYTNALSVIMYRSANDFDEIRRSEDDWLKTIFLSSEYSMVWIDCPLPFEYFNGSFFKIKYFESYRGVLILCYYRCFQKETIKIIWAHLVYRNYESNSV